MEDIKYKIGFFGESRAGKQKIINLFVEGTVFAKESYSTGLSIYEKCVTIDNDIDILLQIWDSAGQERYKLTKQHFFGLNGILLVYDPNIRETFDIIDYWCDTIKDNIDIESVVVFLIENNQSKNNKELHTEVRSESYYEPFDNLISTEIDKLHQEHRELYKYYGHIPRLRAVKSGKIFNYNGHGHGDSLDNHDHDHENDLEGDSLEVIIDEEIIDILLTLEDVSILRNDININQLEYLVEFEYTEVIEYEIQSNVLYQIIVDIENNEITSVKRLF